MSWFMAAIYDRFMRSAEDACLVEWRGALLAGAGGDVLEIGAGTGANLAHYPASVERLVLVEPDRHMRSKLEKKASESGRRIELADAPAGVLPFSDASFDVAVSTLVLCSVDDVEKTLAEIHRVLRPGGSFLFLEHVASGDPSRLAWQRRIEPFWKIAAGNCHLTRHTDESISSAGFELESITRESMRKSMPFVRPSVRGVARKSRAQ